MFKSIKEFFLGKPKSDVVVEQPAAPTPVATPVVEPQVYPVAVIIPSSETTLDKEAWPVKPVEEQKPATKKKRTFVKREDPVAATKPPKPKSRKKK